MRRRNALVIVVTAILLTSCRLVTTDPPPGALGPSPGCGVTTQGPTTDEGASVVVGGETRTYSFTVPPDHGAGTEEAIPLVLDLHGLLEGRARVHPTVTQFSPKAVANGFAVVYPTGRGDGTYWNTTPSESNPDLKFIDTLLAKIQNAMCIDRSRVYVTGLSYGAFMTSMLMCMRPNTFAAAAPVAGLINMCTATERRIPFLTLHGDADRIVPYNLTAGWATPAIAAKYGCEQSPSSTTVQPSPDPVTGGAITRLAWDCSDVDSEIELYRIGRGGHSWPGSAFFQAVAPITGPTATSIDATDIIWDFFSRHQLDASAGAPAPDVESNYAALDGGAAGVLAPRGLTATAP